MHVNCIGCTRHTNGECVVFRDTDLAWKRQHGCNCWTDDPDEYKQLEAERLKHLRETLGLEAHYTAKGAITR